MKALQKASKFLSDYTSIVVIAIAVVTFFLPSMMGWVNLALFTDMVSNKFTCCLLYTSKECVRLAKAAGTEDDKIILDPGVGFGKTYEMNLEIIDKMEILNELGYPVLLGTSRTSVIGLTLDLPVTQREEGTMVKTVYGVQKGCAFVRVHDVEKNKRAIQMTKAIMRGHEV